MPGIGDLLGAAAKQAIKNKIGTGKIRELVGGVLGETAAETIGTTVNQTLEKVGIQKELDGKILIKLPFMKSVEKRTKEALAVHPDWKKICAHLYDDSIKNESTFYDLDGKELYRIKKKWRNLKHVELLHYGNVIGVVQKKLILIKNPLSFAEPYRYSITLHGKELGIIEIRDQKFKPYGKPDFASWEMNGKEFMNHKVLDATGETLAEVWDVTENKYIFDYSDSFDPELLILAFVAFQMREEDKRSKH